MIWTKGHGVDQKEAIFLQCEFRDVGADGVRGETIMWDFSAGAVADDALGVGVTRASALNNISYVAGVLETGSVKRQVNVGTEGFRGRMCLVQCYGYHDAVLIGAGTGSAGNAWLHTGTGNPPGQCTCDNTMSSTAEAVGSFGYPMEVVGGTGAFKCFIKAM